MAMWHFYSCFTINLVIEMTDFLLSTHMRMFTWYISLYYGDMRHTPNSPFFHPSQSRLFFILLFSFRLIKFGLKFQYHSNLIILKIIDIFCCCWKYSIYTQFIFFGCFVLIGSRYCWCEIIYISAGVVFWLGKCIDVFSKKKWKMFEGNKGAAQ